MSFFDRYFHGEYRAARAYLLSKVFLLMVALDAFLLMIGHAGRYGEAGFNVAHFAWLDALQPLPTAGLYIAVLLLSGLLAMTLAFAGSHPLGHALLFVLYTYSWSMSMLDSYQHHYFVSCALLCLVFFPKVSATDIHPLPKPRAAVSSDKKKRKREATQARSDEAESARLTYSIISSLALVAYLLVDSEAHSWLWFVLATGTVVVATYLFPNRSEHPACTRRAFGYNLLGANVAILYTYTAIAKMDAAWFDGATIRRISSAERVFAPLLSWVTQLGMSPEFFWRFVAISVVPLELFVALSYALAVRSDESSSRMLRLLCTLGFLLAMSLHVGAEALGLEIGWFSYYMMLFACVYLLPGSVVDQLSSMVTWPARLLSRWLDDTQDSPQGLRLQLSLLTLSGLLLLWMVGRVIDLPGAQTASFVAMACLAALSLALTLRGAFGFARRALLGAALGAVVMAAAIIRSEVRWDFYRFLGGDLARRGQDAEALEAYVKGERYAPAGQTRQDKIDELRAKLGR